MENGGGGGGALVGGGGVGSFGKGGGGVWGASLGEGREGDMTTDQYGNKRAGQGTARDGRSSGGGKETCRGGLKSREKAAQKGAEGERLTLKKKGEGQTPRSARRTASGDTKQDT